MRLLTTMAGWAGAACLLVNFMPIDSQIPSAQAQPRARESRAREKGRAATKSVRQCMNFKQSMGTDLASVDLSLTSGCKFEVVCSLEWEVSCLPAADGAASAVEKRSSRLALSERWNVNASAGVCEADWEIQDVRWSCAAVEP